MSREKLRARALEDADRDPGKYLARLREQDRALVRIGRRATRRASTLGAVGLSGLVGGIALAVLSAMAAIATPVGWALAGGALVAGLGALSGASSARRKARAANAHHDRLHLGDGGSALEIDGLLARLEVLRNAIAGDYARYERRVLAEVDARRHVDNAPLLQELRARQLAHVARLDRARADALALRQRLVERAITAAVDARLEHLDGARDHWSDARARAAFERDDLTHAITHMTLETDALEELEHELVP